MVDVDASDAPGTPGDTPSMRSVSRPSSEPVGLDSPSVSMSASARGTPPMPLPEGPSGGPKGLDETKMCGICGSGEHYTHNCDNADAKEAARGQCYRCKEYGHSKFFCDAERCLECGEIGHSSLKCQNPNALPKHQKLRLQNEERDLQGQRKQNTERQRQRQMGGHDRKVPVVQATTHTPSSNAESLNSKRKRADSTTDAPRASRPRTNHPNAPPNAPRGPASRGHPHAPRDPAPKCAPSAPSAPKNAPKGPAGSRPPAPPGVSSNFWTGHHHDTLTPTQGLIKPSRDGPSYPSTGNQPMPGLQPSAPRAAQVSVYLVV